MADVATLGLQVESGSVQKGTDALNQLTGAAARAEAAANGLSGTNRGATGAAAAAAKAYATEGAAAASASKQIEMMNRAANQNRASSRGNLGNIAAQFQDIAVSAQMGMGPLQIALQQGTQLAAVLSSMERPVQGLGAAFLSVLSPASLLTIGIIALVAAGLQMVDWAKLAQSALMAVADVLETVAPYAIAAAAALALIYAPSIVVGIVNVIAVLSRLIVAAGTVAASFTAAWLAAMGPVGWVIAGFSAVLAAAIIFRDEMQQIFGRDIVADAKTGANFVIGSFVAAYHDIKFLWGQFPNVIGAAAIGAANAVIKAMTDMVQRGAGLIDSFASKANQWLPEGMQLGTIGDLGLDKDFQFANKYAEELAAAADKRNGQIASDLSADYLGDFGGAIARGASAATSKLKELAASLTEVDEKSKKRTGGKSEQEKYSDIVAAAERQIAALEAERDAIGLTEQAAAALRYETQLLNEAQQRGISLTDAQKSELSSLAQVMASIEEETRQMGIALDFAKEVTGGFFDDFFAGIENGKSVWASFGDAALGVLDRIADKLLNDVLDAVFQVSGAGAGAGGGGLLSWLFGGGSKVDPWAGLRGYANGTSSARSGVAWVGEKGPELVRFKGGEEVIPNHRLQRPANGNVAPSGGQLNQNGPREIILRVIAEEGPMFRPVIRSESRGVSVETIKQYDAAKANIYQNGEDR
ncbi:phage tail length tape measure family protein [Sinorhizobium meliloti]|uniref:phage tail length tape measure family protein n=2 Tax=Rhizobium meliloti TaxID=382 RepID=UPI000B49C368|nr:phage tail length tape measure family protein [Sinorhizobium meliloti]ASP63405.1 phage tail tape-measure protein [Sinorhizobium meliloti]MDE3771511.1 phage tail length tape measure family protein [Sinorhizobium meliloti]MDE3790519.1 phage tail length tape measure family protein [Sinorhizobium meliloti]MDW9517252.1 phage tail tape-measure protein [Sinorhizobium meliloti]MDW9709784.1 phage tail tape-measure protein [Sinorhizobium meliloti]